MMGVAHCAPTVCSVGLAALFAWPISSVPTEFMEQLVPGLPGTVSVHISSNANATFDWEMTVVHAPVAPRVTAIAAVFWVVFRPILMMSVTAVVPTVYQPPPLISSDFPGPFPEYWPK